MSMPKLRRLYARAMFYPTLAWNFTLARVLGVRRWWDHIEPHVIVGAYPFARDVAALHQAGVRAVVNTCEEYPGPLQQYAQHGIEQLHVPTTDFTHPRLDDIARAVEFVQGQVAADQTVYIHCKAGRARSATVALCWLIKYRGMTPEQGQQLLRKCRPQVNPRLSERAVVRQYASQCYARQCPDRP
jgi:atypical dual specificity phosphatase